MASMAAKAVAKEVLETLGKGKKPSVTKIAVKNGYTAATAKSGVIQKTKSYRSVIDPFLLKLIRLREKTVVQAGKRLSKANYKDSVYGMDKLTQNIQLLSGKSTSNVAHMHKIVKEKRASELDEILDEQEDD